VLLAWWLLLLWLLVLWTLDAEEEAEVDLASARLELLCADEEEEECLGLLTEVVNVVPVWLLLWWAVGCAVTVPLWWVEWVEWCFFLSFLVCLPPLDLWWTEEEEEWWAEAEAVGTMEGMVRAVVDALWLELEAAGMADTRVLMAARPAMREKCMMAVCVLVLLVFVV